MTRHLIRTAVRRGWRKRCPHCGVGHLFDGWAHHIDACPACGLVYEKNAGDTWAFTVLGDRLPIGAMVLLVYFSLFRTHHALGFAAFALIAAGFVWTLPNRWGVGIALHYLSRVYWPDPADPVPGMPGREDRSRRAGSGA